MIHVIFNAHLHEVGNKYYVASKVESLMDMYIYTTWL